MHVPGNLIRKYDVLIISETSLMTQITASSTGEGGRRMLLARRFRLALAAAARARPLSSSSSAHVEFVASENENKEPSSSKGGDTLGRRLLSLVYPKRSAVIVLRKWAEQGKTIQKYQLNRVVRELRKFNRYKHALEVQYTAFFKVLFLCLTKCPHEDWRGLTH